MLLGDVLILVNENSWGTCTHTRPKQIREGKYHNRLLPSKFNLVPIPNFFFFFFWVPANEVERTSSQKAAIRIEDG